MPLIEETSMSLFLDTQYKFSRLDLASTEDGQPHERASSTPCSNFIEFLEIAWSGPDSARVGLHPILTGALPDLSDVSMGGITFDVRKVKTESFPLGLQDDVLQGRDYLVVKQPRLSSEGRLRPGDLDQIAVELQILDDARTRKHPNIIDLLGLIFHNAGDSTEPKIVPALVVEYAEWQNLQLFQEAGFGIDIRDKHSICMDVAKGLRYLHHDARIIHGDVKRANMLVCRHPSRAFIVKVSDFGFAVSMTDESPRLLGRTLHYDAPETTQPLNTSLLPQLDIYSYGLLLFEVLRGGIPFYSFITDLSKMESLKSTNILPDLLQLSLINNMQDVRFPLLIFCKVMTYCLRADPRERWPSMDAMGDLLQLTKPELVESQLHLRETFVRMPVAQFQENKDQWMDRFETAMREAEHLNQQRHPLWLRLSDSYRQRGRHEIDIILNGPTPQVDGVYRKNLALDAVIFKSSNELKTAIETSQLFVDRSIVPIKISCRPKPDFSNRYSILQKLSPVVKRFIYQELLETFQQTDDPEIKANFAYNLALMYLDGMGCCADINRGIELLESAAGLGCTKSRRFMAYILNSRKDLAAGRVLTLDTWILEVVRECDRPLIESLRKSAPQELVKLQMSWRIQRQIDIDRIGTSCPSIGWKARLVHLAASCGDLEVLASMLAEDARLVHVENAYRQTPLITACQSGCTQAAELLIELGAETYQTDIDGFGCLHWLVSFPKQDQITIAEMLICGGAEVDAFGKWPASQEQQPPPNVRGGPEAVTGTPLHWAIAMSDLDLIDFLLEIGASVTTRPDEGTKSAFEMASRLGDSDILERMLRLDSVGPVAAHFLPLASNKEPEVNALFWTLAGGDPRLGWLKRYGLNYRDKLHKSIDLLTNAGCSCDAVLKVGTLKMSAPFACAFHQANSELLEGGLSSGFSPHLESTFGGASSGGPAMSLAIAQQDREMFRILTEAGASTTWTNAYDYSPLSVVAKETDDVWFAQQLIERGAEINVSPRSPFYIAVYAGNLAMARYLWDRGARRDLKNGNGLTILGRMVMLRTNNACQRIKFLLSLPGRENDDGFIASCREGDTPRESSVLHLAASEVVTGRDHSEDPAAYEICRLTFSLLLNAYVTSEHVNSTQGARYSTPLVLVVGLGNHHATRMLLEAGADPSIQDQDGCTPMDKVLTRHCSPEASLALSSFDPHDDSEQNMSNIEQQLRFVNSNTAELYRVLQSYGAKGNAFVFPAWYSSDSGSRSLSWVVEKLKQKVGSSR